MTRSTTWRRMAHPMKHPLLNLGMGTLLPLSSQAGDWARRVRCRSQTTSRPSGLTPTSNRRARKPQQPRSRRALR